MRGLEGLQRNNRGLRMRAFENEMRLNPGAAPNGTGRTGLMSGDARGWSDLLNRQAQYLNDTRADEGDEPYNVVAAGPMRSRTIGSAGSALGGLRGALQSFGGARGGSSGVVAHEVRPDTRPLERALIDAGISEAGARQRTFDDMGGERDELRAFRQQQYKDSDLRRFAPDRARAAAQIGDIESEAEAGRMFLPNRARVDDLAASRARQLAETRYLRPAQIDAEAKLRASEIEREGRVTASQNTLQGVRGRNQTAAMQGLIRAMEYDTELRKSIEAELIRGQQEGRSAIDVLGDLVRRMGGMESGGGGDDEMLDFEDAIAELMDLGLSREEAEAELRGSGGEPDDGWDALGPYTQGMGRIGQRNFGGR